MPLPTPSQQAAFARHLCCAHSWYKHLPLVEGAEFVIVLAEDAAAGFTEASPAPHFGWRTAAEYRERFGGLDYLRRLDDGCWHRDFHPAPPAPTAAQRARGGLRLYPFALYDLDAFEWRGLHGEDLERLVATPDLPHPYRAELLRWHALDEALERGLDALSEPRAEAAWAHLYPSAQGAAPLPTLDAAQRSVVAAWQAIDRLRRALEDAERARVEAVTARVVAAAAAA